jgi:hypothetical protein
MAHEEIFSAWEEYKAEGARLVTRLGLPQPSEGLEIVPMLKAMLDRIERIEEQLRVRP